MSKASWNGSTYLFKKFEKLIMYDLLRYQHQLVKLQAEMEHSDGNLSDGSRQSLRLLVREYRRAPKKSPPHRCLDSDNSVEKALLLWRSTLQLQPSPQRTVAEWYATVAQELHEPNYICHEDSLSGFDINQPASADIDLLTTLLHQVLPARYAVSEDQD